MEEKEEEKEEEEEKEVDQVPNLSRKDLLLCDLSVISTPWLQSMHSLFFCAVFIVLFE